MSSTDVQHVAKLGWAGTGRRFVMPRPITLLAQARLSFVVSNQSIIFRGIIIQGRYRQRCKDTSVLRTTDQFNVLYDQIDTYSTLTIRNIYLSCLQLYLLTYVDLGVGMYVTDAMSGSLYHRY